MPSEVFLQRTQALPFKTRQNALWLISLGVVLLCVLGAIPSSAQDSATYSFVLLVEYPPVSRTRLGLPSINNTGTVAFVDRRGADHGIQVVDEHHSAVIATNAEFALYGLAAINDAGRVAFDAQELSTNHNGIMVCNEHKRTYVVAPNDPNFLFVGAINATLKRLV